MEATPPSDRPAEPGWYPDPEVPGGQRYWDGSQWTENRAPAAQAAAVPAAQDPQARQWALWSHLSALAGLFIGLSFLGPLIIWAIKKDDDPFIKDQAQEALNFNLTVFLAGIVCFLLVFVIIGFLLLPVLAVAWIVFTIIAATRANRGEAYRYPVSIRFISG
jgi:uncharacterized Tic20 family protein